MQKYPDPPAKVYKSKVSYTGSFDSVNGTLRIYTDGVETDFVSITDILRGVYTEKKLWKWVGSFYPRTHSRKEITKDVQKIIDLVWPRGPFLKIIDREQRKKKRERLELEESVFD